ncbi:MAG TPA: hypothetical protein VHM19_20235, partial [Polyangiales bacterium]|nr:hypothetical protein [Polyangiales bacterium]
TGSSPERDPFLSALPARTDAAVFDIVRLGGSEIGRLMTKCYELDKQVSGPWKLEDFDRIAIVSDEPAQRMIVLSGKLTNVLSGMVQSKQPPQPYGTESRIYAAEGLALGGIGASAGAGGAGADAKPGAAAAAGAAAPAPPAVRYIGVWRNDVIVISAAREQVERAIDRIEGRSQQPLFVPDEEAYGAIYGELLARQLIAFAPRDLQTSVNSTNLRVRFHVDVSGDVLVSARAYGAPDVTSLGQALVDYLTKLRAAIETMRDTSYANLVGDISVEQAKDSFTLNLAVPLTTLKTVLGPCAN